MNVYKLEVRIEAASEDAAFNALNVALGKLEGVTLSPTIEDLGDAEEVDEEEDEDEDEDSTDEEEPKLN